MAQDGAGWRWRRMALALDGVGARWRSGRVALVQDGAGPGWRSSGGAEDEAAIPPPSPDDCPFATANPVLSPCTSQCRPYSNAPGLRARGRLTLPGQVLARTVVARSDRSTREKERADGAPQRDIGPCLLPSQTRAVFPLVEWTGTGLGNLGIRCWPIRRCPGLDGSGRGRAARLPAAARPSGMKPASATTTRRENRACVALVVLRWNSGRATRGGANRGAEPEAGCNVACACLARETASSSRGRKMRHPCDATLKSR